MVDDSFHCKEEKDNEYDKHVVAIIDPTFQKGNRLSVLSFENENCNISFSIYYVPKFETKGYNALIDGKSFKRFLGKTNNKHIKYLWISVEIMIVKQEISYIMNIFVNTRN